MLEDGGVNPKVYKTVPKIVPSDHYGQGLDGVQSNWIGPFTHAGGFTANDPYANPSTQTGAGGDNWGGGSQWFGGKKSSSGQIYPFPIIMRDF